MRKNFTKNIKKRKVFLLFILIFLFTIFLSLYCSKQFFDSKKAQKTNLKNRFSYTIGIIITTQDKNKSILKFYDENLNFIKSKYLPYGALADCMTLPAANQNSIYFIPRGVPQKEELEIALDYNPISHTFKKYKIGMPSLLQIAASDDAVFTINELNFTSYITKYSKDMRECSQVSSETFSYDAIYYYDKFLYATGKKKTEENTKYYLFQIDANSLKTIHKEDITAYGQGNLFFCGVGEDIYFTLPYDGQEQKNNSLMIFHLKSKKVEEIKLNDFFPQQIKRKNDLLLISHSDLIEGTGNNLSIFNLNTKKSKKISLSHPISQIETEENSNSVYILGDDILYRYILDKEKEMLFLQEKISIPCFDKEIDEAAYYYIGGFFLAKMKN